MSDLIDRQAVIEKILGQPPEAHYPSWYARQIEDLPPAQPEQDREFMKLAVRNSNGRPYYSIIYLEFDDNGVGHDFEGYSSYSLDVISDYLKKYFMPSVQPERLSDDDFETIRIHLSAAKERLCNQHRWKEAEEYERLIERFMAFSSTEPERKTGRWIVVDADIAENSDICECSLCGGRIWRYRNVEDMWNYCPRCGADMRGEQDGSD